MAEVKENMHRDMHVAQVSLELAVQQRLGLQVQTTTHSRKKNKLYKYIVAEINFRSLCDACNRCSLPLTSPAGYLSVTPIPETVHPEVTFQVPT